jgi:dienelactone hydrolase
MTRTPLLALPLLALPLLAMTLLPAPASAAPVAAAAAPVAAAAGLATRSVEYTQGDTPLEGLLVLDPAGPAKRPGVVLVPDWMGMSPRATAYGEKLAGLGYVVLVADVYGKGIHPASGKEAGPLAGKYKGDRALLRARVNAALDVLRRQPQVDGTRLAAVGYCFGGMGALELARSGASLSGVVTFHGSLGSPTPADAKQIKAKVLALHGADDPFVPEAEVKGFEDELRAAGVDWQLVKYSGAVHSFTNPDAGTDNSKGAAYNPVADRRSWEAMKAFFAEVLK